MNSETKSENSEILIYQTADGDTKLEVKLENESVWLTQNQMAELFQSSKQNIGQHIKNIFEEGELEQVSTVKDFFTVQTEGSREIKRSIEYYNLDVIISVGYRVKSHQGTQFRIWATKRLREYIVKGFTLDDERLKNGSHYFDELLERIREIRASERNFYRKVLDVYSTSIDYNPDSENAVQFFKIAQNKLHWAVSGKTAAEIVVDRADSSKQNMGLTSFKGKKPSKDEVVIAKNYLHQDEISILNRLVAQYLEFAELQATRRKAMYMKDWEEKLNDFLKLNDMEILTHAGKISHALAEETALKEYKKFQKQNLLADDSEIHPDLEKHLKKQGIDMELAFSKEKKIT